MRNLPSSPDPTAMAPRHTRRAAQQEREQREEATRRLKRIRRDAVEDERRQEEAAVEAERRRQEAAAEAERKRQEAERRRQAAAEVSRGDEVQMIQSVAQSWEKTELQKVKRVARTLASDDRYMRRKKREYIHAVLTAHSGLQPMTKQEQEQEKEQEHEKERKRKREQEQDEEPSEEEQEEEHEEDEEYVEEAQGQEEEEEKTSRFMTITVLAGDGNHLCLNVAQRKTMTRRWLKRRRMRLWLRTRMVAVSCWRSLFRRTTTFRSSSRRL